VNSPHTPEEVGKPWPDVHLTQCEVNGLALDPIKNTTMRYYSEEKVNGLVSALMDADGPVLLNLRELLSAEVEALGWRDEDGERLTYRNDPDMEPLGSRLSDQTRNLIAAAFRDFKEGGNDEG
jgi:hypothetical protein